MRERPILMSAPMVRACMRELDPKTQTRRPIRDTGLYAIDEAVHGAQVAKRERDNLAKRCQYGQPGDRLWVRERHCFLDVTKSRMSQFPLGPENDNAVGPDVWNVDVEYSDGFEHLCSVEGAKPKQTRQRGELGWRPGIHMPRWACRIVLEIVELRVQRLQEISEADAIAEGFARRPEISDDPEVHRDAARDWYIDLWDSLNAARGYSWATNPFVWAITFRRIRA